MNRPSRILTIGHSTLATDAFLAILTAHSVELLADVRRFPQGTARLIDGRLSYAAARMDQRQLPF